jgi:squalene-hopene/tetraprenyl-beta-curcumene cyclase
VSNLCTICLLGVLMGAEPVAQSLPDDAEVRKVIERSLPFMEKGAVEWVEKNKCVTCHHVPMMLWTHYEARQHGFTVNEKATLELERQALAQYLGHPDFTPTGQDTGFMEQTLGPGTIYLSLALQANASPVDEAVGALERFRDNFVKLQNENGSWTTKVNQAPLVDDHDSMTMLILTALDNGDRQSKNREARNRAVQWLKGIPVREESQSLALRILVAERSGDKEQVRRYVELVRSRQQDDGGWNQVDGLSTDALATGQVLYALKSAGTSPDDSAVQRGRGFLASTQKDDGSWVVHTRNPNGKGFVTSYYGTGWATLGLLRTLPQPVGAER